ncbi:MAG: hypothetical protein QHH75_06945 [Bacillota bacterium]|nr:hypothetical protein [Bacillota bacterium]
MRLKEVLHLFSAVQEELEQLGRLKLLLEEKGFFTADRAKKVLSNEIILRGVAGILQDYYSGVERLFKRIALEVDEKLPKGESWHKELLSQMKREIPGLRPPVISHETFQLLDGLRGFRHRVGNIYAFDLVPQKVAPHLFTLPEIDARLRQDVTSFLFLLKKSAEEEIERE